MKTTFTRTLVAASLPLLIQAASAAILLTDTFTVLPGGTNNQDVNQALAGRLGGTLAPGLIASGTAYTGTSWDHHQVGNTTTDVGQPVVSDGNYVLMAFDGGFQCAVDIASAAVGPLIVSFDMYHFSADNLARVGGDQSHWTAFTLRGPNGGDSWPIVGAGEFGMLQRYSGGVQLFQNGNSGITPGGYDTPGFATNPHWQITFTDTAGTGSAFNGNGSVMSFVNGSTTGSVTLGQLKSSGLQLGWRSYAGMFGGIDNLSIETVPEPAAALLLSIGCLGLMARRRN